MPKSILMVDPDAAFRQRAAKAFQARGYELHENPDGRDVLDQVRTLQPEALVLNVELPRGSGYAICSKLRKDGSLRAIKVILTSAEATQKAFDDHKKLKLGRADEYLRKPYEIDDLTRTVMELLGDEFEPEPQPEDERESDANAHAGEEKVSLEDIEEIAVDDALEFGDADGGELSASPALPGEGDVDLLESAFQRLEEPRSDPESGLTAEVLEDQLPEGDEDPLEVHANEVLNALESEPEERTVIGYPRSPPSEVTVSSPPSALGRDRDYSQVKDKLSQRERDLLRLREDLNAREKEAVEHRERETNFERELARKKEDIGKRDAQIRQLQQRIEALIAGQRRSEKDLQASREEVRSTTQRAEAAENASRGQQRALDDNLGQLTIDLENARNRIEELQSESESLRARNQELEAEVTELRGQRSEIENEKSRDEERLVNATDRLRQAERIREKAKEAVALALQLLEDSVGEIDDADIEPA